MEGRGADEEHEKYWISQMSSIERIGNFRVQLEVLMKKWHVPEPLRDELRSVSDGYTAVFMPPARQGGGGGAPGGGPVGGDGTNGR